MTIFIMRMLSVLPLVAVIVTTGAAPAKVEDRSGSAEEFDLVAFLTQLGRFFLACKFLKILNMIGKFVLRSPRSISWTPYTWSYCS